VAAKIKPCRPRTDRDRLILLWAISSACARRPEGVTVFDIIRVLGVKYSRLMGARREHTLTWLRANGLAEWQRLGRSFLWRPTPTGLATLAAAYASGECFES